MENREPDTVGLYGLYAAAKGAENNLLLKFNVFGDITMRSSCHAIVSADACCVIDMERCGCTPRRSDYNAAVTCEINSFQSYFTCLLQLMTNMFIDTEIIFEIILELLQRLK